MSVTASVSKGTLSYQWYSNTTRSNTGGSLISGATDDAYSAPTGTAGTTYYYCVVTNTDTTATGSQTAQKASSAAEVVVNEEQLAAPTAAAESASYNSINVSWSQVPGAIGYQIYRSTQKYGSYSLVHTASQSEFSWINSGLTTGKTYYYQALAFTTSGGSTVYSQLSGSVSATPVPSKPNVNPVSISYTSVKASWSAVSGATGYELWYASQKFGTYSMISTANSGAAGSYTKNKLTTDKTYYFKARAFRMVSGQKVYGDYSAIQSTAPGRVSMTVSRLTSTKAKVNWIAVSGSAGYEVWRSTQKNGTYALKHTASVSGTSWTNSGLTTGKAYYYKVRAYRMIGGEKVYGQFSAINSIIP